MDKIICLGKNYLDHAEEMAARGDIVPEKPVLFLKPPSAIVQARATGERIRARLPSYSKDVHPEVEIVLRMGQGGKVDAVTLGLDVTLRDLQSELKKKGQPWEISKAFPDSAILGPWISAAEFRDYLDTPFAFSVDGTARQSGTGRQMRLSPDECIRHAARHFGLLPGDLIFTGTPAGVAAVRDGQIGVVRWADKLSYEVLWHEA